MQPVTILKRHSGEDIDHFRHPLMHYKCNIDNLFNFLSVKVTHLIQASQNQLHVTYIKLQIHLCPAYRL